MKNMKEVSRFQEFQTKVWKKYAWKKVDPEMFSFWVKSIFARKQMMQSY